MFANVKIRESMSGICAMNATTSMRERFRFRRETRSFTHLIIRFLDLLLVCGLWDTKKLIVILANHTYVERYTCAQGEHDGYVSRWAEDSARNIAVFPRPTVAKSSTDTKSRHTGHVERPATMGN